MPPSHSTAKLTALLGRQGFFLPEIPKTPWPPPRLEAPVSSEEVVHPV